MYFFKSLKIVTEEEEVLVSKNFVTFAGTESFKV